MATPLAIEDFRDDDQTPNPIRWVDRMAIITNGQLIELKTAIDAQGSTMAELQADLMTNREGLSRADRILDEHDITLTQHDDRLDSVELVLDSDQLPIVPSPPLISPAPPVPDTRMFGNHGNVTEVVSLEEYTVLHELGEALGRAYRCAGITTWDQAVATFRIGWEVAIPDAERPNLASVLGWLDRQGESRA